MTRPSMPLRRARPLLGTLVEISIETDVAAEPGAACDISQLERHEETFDTAFNAAFAAIERVHRLMSFHDVDSDVSRINRAAVGVTLELSPWTWEVLDCAQRLNLGTGGLFDVSIAGELVDQGFLPGDRTTCPGSEVAKVGAAFELTDAHCMRWVRKGMIDLGGIAKGFAVDQALRAMQNSGARSIVLNAGGDLAGRGLPFPVYVRHPAQPSQLIALGELQNLAMATSAGYHAVNHRESDSIHPLVDPRTARCVQWPGSVSVIAPSCMVADALTKVAGLSDRAQWQQLDTLLTAHHAQALMLDTQGMTVLGWNHLQID